MAAKPQTSDERKRAFNALFQTVKADGEGTAMGSTDKARDEALGGLTFDKLPDHAPEYQLPDAPVEKEEHAGHADDLHEGREGGPTQPLKLDEKHKKFYQLFDHVTDVQATEYGGQAVAPNKDVEFEALPDKPQEHPLPDVSKVPERDYLQEDMEARQRTAQPEQKHSQRYDKAHDAFVKTFGDPVGEN